MLIWDSNLVLLSSTWAIVMMGNGMNFAITPLLAYSLDSDTHACADKPSQLFLFILKEVFALCRHAATMDSSSSPEARSPPSPLDSLAGDVRQRLMFDWQESRFGEMAEPDPLSFGSPQQAQHAQQADRAGQNMGAMSNTFQVWHTAPLRPAMHS